MARNDVTRFSENPANVGIERSKFSRHTDVKTTLNAGKLVPFYVDEILPGDTFDVSTSSVFRMATPLKPVMDNCYLDTFYFFVPSRMLWEHFEEFHGASSSAWDQQIDYEIPQFPVPIAGFELGSLADYFGIPTYTGGGDSVNALPFRAYRKIWNDWFRDENLMDEVMLNLGDHELPESESGYDLNEVLPVCKLHDYFTSALPAPQKGDPVLLPLNGDASVFIGDYDPTYFDRYDMKQLVVSTNRKGYLGLTDSTVSQPGTSQKLKFFGTFGTEGDWAASNRAIVDMKGVDPIRDTPAATALDSWEGYELGNVNVGGSFQPVNLYADLSSATMTTINELRLAFQVQKVLERDARGGTRYTEMVRSHFNVISPDARLQRSEYLGGTRIDINLQEVTQTSSTTGDQLLGTVGAFSKTTKTGHSFTKSFTEHGYILGLMCIRTDRTYQQGLNKMWSRKRRFDFYLPAFAHIGEQPVLKKEIYWSNDSDQNESVFGYQEAWADYRYKPSTVTGYFRSNAPGGSLDSWHYADDYDSVPYLSEAWLLEPKTNIDRTIGASSEYVHQFIADIYLKIDATRPMPVYSIPGLIDHF